MRRICCARCTRRGHIDLLACAKHHSDSTYRTLLGVLVSLGLICVLLVIF